MKKTAIVAILLCACIPAFYYYSSADWPIYKGNIYFTGNNDELVVKKGRLKWLYQSTHTVLNPVVSGSQVYAVDMGKNIHAVDLATGQLKWKTSVTKAIPGKSSGALRYPLVVGNRLLVCDNTTLYCLDTKSGAVLWARVGSPDSVPKASALDGIYALPMVHEESVVYGTRNVFLARSITNGGVQWTNGDIKTYSGFPSFYDKYVFTQSMDYGADTYTVFCLLGQTGKVQWGKEFPKPHRIFSPVIYHEKVYLPVSDTLHCLDMADGKDLWSRKYDELITSSPSFTEEDILFAAGNKRVMIVDPATGEETGRFETGDQSAPYFVTIQDQIYIASIIKKKMGDKDTSFARVAAYRMKQKEPLWTYTAPFDGAPSQPSAARGLLLVPAGKCIYAIGDPYGKEIDGEDLIADGTEKKQEGDDDFIIPQDLKKDETADKTTPAKTKLKDIYLTVVDKKGSDLTSLVDVIQWDQGKEIYSEKSKINGKKQKIQVPDSDAVELLLNSEDHLPKKIILSKGESEYQITLDKIQKGKSYVIDHILFELNEAYLLPESLPILQQLLAMMRQNPSLRIEVRGYTDSTGTREHNLVLSRRRAQAVVEFLVKNGISPLRLRAVGFGPDNPVADNNTAEGRRLNRRTEVFIVEQ